MLDADRPVEVVRETLLARAPNKASGLVALGSLGVLLFTSLLYWGNPLSVARALPATPEALFERGEYWRALTAIGVHSDLEHLLSNALGFGILSYLLYGYFGASVYPAFSLALGAVVNGVSVATYPQGTALIGSSGVVYLMAGFWLTIYVLVERRFSLAKRLLRCLGFAFVTLVPPAFVPSVSYRTHALGLAVGVAFGASYFAARRERIRNAERVEWE